MRRLSTSPYFASESKLFNLSGFQLTCNCRQIYSLISLGKRCKVSFFWAVPRGKNVIAETNTLSILGSTYHIENF